MLISVPTSKSKIFQLYFETVWNMEAHQDWKINYEKQNLIKDIMIECGYNKMSCFWMLTMAHDIIYDRD